MSQCVSLYYCVIVLSLFVSFLVAVSSRLFRAELQASDSRYQAQRRITQLLQTELLQLYSRVEMEAPASTAASSPPGGRADPHTSDSRSLLIFLLLALYECFIIFLFTIAVPL